MFEQSAATDSHYNRHRKIVFLLTQILWRTSARIYRGLKEVAEIERKPMACYRVFFENSRRLILTSSFSLRENSCIYVPAHAGETRHSRKLMFSAMPSLIGRLKTASKMSPLFLISSFCFTKTRVFTCPLTRAKLVILGSRNFLRCRV